MKKNITIGEKYNPITKVKTRKKAAAYFEKCVKHTMSFGKSRQEAESIERKNIGYYAGYFNDETQQRVNNLFLVTHPVFGNNDMSLQDAFFAGVKAANEEKLG